MKHILMICYTITMKILHQLFYGLSLGSIVVTGYYALNMQLFALGFFALTPYIATIFILYIAKHNTAVVTAQVVTLFIVSVGLYFLLDTTYMERRLSYKFSFLFIPIWQWTMLLVTGFVIYLSNDKVVDVSEKREDVWH